MTSTNITVRMDARQTSGKQSLPLHTDMNNILYGLQVYKIALKNTNYNIDGMATISSHDEWNKETEWDDIFEQMKKEM